MTQEKINRKTCNKNDIRKVKFHNFNQLTGAKKEFRIRYSKHIEDMKRYIYKPMNASHILDCTHECGKVRVEDNVEILKKKHERQIMHRYVCEEYSTHK